MSALHDEVDAERERAHRKHGATSMRNSAWDAHRRVSILTEEVREAARVLNDCEHGIHDEHSALPALRHELVQVAAMAMDWLAEVDRQLSLLRTPTTPTTEIAP